MLIIYFYRASHTGVLSLVVTFSYYYCEIALTLNASIEIRKRNTRLSRTSIMIVVELVEVVSVYAPPASPIIEGGSLVLKRVEILSRKRHKLFEIRISAGTCPTIVTQTVMLKNVHGDDKIL